MNIILSIIFMCLILFSSSGSQSMDSFADSSTLQCAVSLFTSKENYLFFNRLAAGLFAPFARYFEEALARYGNLPLIEMNVPAINRFRNAINHGMLTDETKYVSFVLEDEFNGDKYLAYGKVIAVGKNIRGIEIHLEILDGEHIILTGFDLYHIGLSGRSKEIFERRASGGRVHTPKIKIGQDVLFPLSSGGFSNGKVLVFIGDQAIVSSFENDLDITNSIIRFVPIQSLRPPLQRGDSISISNQFAAGDVAFTAFVLSAIENSIFVTLRAEENEMESGSIIHPKEIIEILNQSTAF